MYSCENRLIRLRVCSTVTLPTSGQFANGEKSPIPNVSDVAISVVVSASGRRSASSSGSSKCSAMMRRCRSCPALPTRSLSSPADDGLNPMLSATAKKPWSRDFSWLCTQSANESDVAGSSARSATPTNDAARTGSFASRRANSGSRSRFARSVHERTTLRLNGWSDRLITVTGSFVRSRQRRTKSSTSWESGLRFLSRRRTSSQSRRCAGRYQNPRLAAPAPRIRSIPETRRFNQRRLTATAIRALSRCAISVERRGNLLSRALRRPPSSARTQSARERGKAPVDDHRALLVPSSGWICVTDTASTWSS